MKMSEIKDSATGCCELLLEDALSAFRPQFAKLNAVADRFPGPLTSEGCEQFSRQVYRVEGAIQDAYAITSSAVKRCGEDRLCIKIWQSYINLVDILLAGLNGLVSSFPDCGTPELHDLALEYRKAAQDRIELLKEEMECQIPEGLFPSLS